MKNLLKLTVVLLLTFNFGLLTVQAQTPNEFKYQAVLRDASGAILASEAVTVDISILQGSASGTSVFDETHNVTTTAQGLINLNIGSVEDLSVVDFGADTYFIEITVDGTVMGTSQLLSVPYALQAKTAENVFSGDYNDLTNKPDLTIYATKDMNSENITNLADPVNDQDAATKAYVDEIIDNLYAQGALKLVDIDGNQYEVVKIGNQIWMAEDLRVTTYPNGTPIPHVTDNTAWVNLGDNNTDDAYCFYNNDNTTDYGALYTYAAAIGDNWVNDNAANQGVCPDGWHLPTDAEWTELTDYLGGTSVAGGKMKETGTSHWNSPNTGATNSSGFSALPGGDRYYDGGTFYSLGNYGDWWSATESSGTDAWGRYLYYGNAEAYRYSFNKSNGFSVRCVRD